MGASKSCLSPVLHFSAQSQAASQGCVALPLWLVAAGFREKCFFPWRLAVERQSSQLLARCERIDMHYPLEFRALTISDKKSRKDNLLVQGGLTCTWFRLLWQVLHRVTRWM